MVWELQQQAQVHSRLQQVGHGAMVQWLGRVAVTMQAQPVCLLLPL
jgi:hypothetical protein